MRMQTNETLAIIIIITLFYSKYASIQVQTLTRKKNENEVQR